MTIEQRPERAAKLVIEDVSQPLIALCADAAFLMCCATPVLIAPKCAGLLAMTSRDDVNQTIAIGARTLRSDLQIIARVKDATAQQNLLALGGIQVVNPFGPSPPTSRSISTRRTCCGWRWLTDSPDAHCPNRGHSGRAVGDRRLRPLRPRHRACSMPGTFPWRAVDHRGAGAIDDEQHQLVVDDDTDRALGGADVANAAVVVAGTDNDAASRPSPHSPAASARRSMW